MTRVLWVKVHQSFRMYSDYTTCTQLPEQRNHINLEVNIWKLIFFFLQTVLNCKRWPNSITYNRKVCYTEHLHVSASVIMIIIYHFAQLHAACYYVVMDKDGIMWLCYCQQIPTQHFLTSCVWLICYHWRHASERKDKVTKTGQFFDTFLITGLKRF